MNSNVALPDGPSPQARFRLFGPGRFDKRKIAAGVVVIAVFVAAVYAVYRCPPAPTAPPAPSQTGAQPPPAAPVVKAPSGAKTSAHTKPGSRGGSVGSAPATTRTGVASSCAVSDATAH